MKNLYIYGDSDDRHEVNSDFGVDDEFTGDAMLNQARITWKYHGDWKITIEEGNLPTTWKVKKIKGTSDFIHIQIPDDAYVTITEAHDWDDLDEDDVPGYLMDFIEGW